MVGKVPSDTTTHLHEISQKSIHSIATAVADARATSDQMQDFFGWANAKMTTEYISTSKAAIFKVAEKACDESSKLANECTEVVQESQVSDFEELWDD